MSSSPAIERQHVDSSKENNRYLSPEAKRRLTNLTVIHIAPPWLPVPMSLREYGGVETVIDDLLDPLRRLGIQRQIVYGHAANDVLSGNSIDTRTPSSIRAERDYFKLFESQPEVADEVYRKYVKQVYDEITAAFETKMLDPQNTVIHDHTVVGRMHAKRLAKYGVPVIATEHERVNRDEGDIREIYNAAVSPNLFSVAISLDQLTSNPELHWLGVIPHGINLDNFEFAVEKAGDPELGNYGLFLGLVCKRKGTHHAVKAAQETNTPLIIAGPIEQTTASRTHFEDEIAPHLSKKIRYIGAVGREERRTLLRDASWLAMLNEWEEPFGLVIVEALASGTPVVGRRRGSISGIVKDGVTGYVVEDPMDASEAVKKIMDTDNQAMNQECRDVAEWEYSAATMSNRYARAYLEAIDIMQKRTPHRRNLL